jgi:cell division protein FtsN
VAPPPSTGPSGYLLQVGAFPSAADAETLKAKLALQGFVANVQSVTVGGQTYHRVRLGPFRSATDLESTKQRLSAAGISAIALKAGG